MAFTASAQWNPYAGVITSFTWEAKVTTSSGGNGKEVNDRNEKTFWQSGSPYPYDFINRPDLNILKAVGKSDRCSSSGTSNCEPATDGDLKTNVVMRVHQGSAWLQFSFRNAIPLHVLAIKCVASLPVKVYAYQASGDSILLATCKSMDNYEWKRFPAKVEDVVKIRLVSSAQFSIYEIAALSKPPVEYVILDLGKPREVGWIETRHWAGGQAVGTRLLAGMDKVHWQELEVLNPEALFTVTTRLNEPVTARYIKVEHALNEDDYGKAFVWEVNAYDEYGPYGMMPAPVKSLATVAEIIGINGIWSWGYDIHSDQLAAGQGPTLFNKVASHARNFHNLHWDVTDPDTLPDFFQMSRGEGTQAKSWLNWDKEYGAWKKAGLKVQVSVKFNEKTVPQSLWNDPFKAGYHYGYAFAWHFGPTNGNGLVEVMEAGNEPWDFPASFYREVLHGMVQGAKAADPAMIVLSCALQAGFPEEESKDGGNFIGARITEADAIHLDGVNVHHYSYAYNQDGKRLGVHPEFEASSLRGVLNDIRFRDENMPGKKIYVSEWGWDSDGAGETCTHSECVSEMEQALYAIRGALMFIRLGVDRLTWYFYANGGGGLYSRSGLIGSKQTGFTEKRSFRVFEALRNFLGDTYFLKVLQEDKEAWVYQFGDASGIPTHVVAWKPVKGEETTMSHIELASEKAPRASWRINGNSSAGELDTESVKYSGRKLRLKVTAVPLVIELITSD